MASKVISMAMDSCSLSLWDRGEGLDRELGMPFVTCTNGRTANQRSAHFMTCISLPLCKLYHMHNVDFCMRILCNGKDDLFTVDEGKTLAASQLSASVRVNDVRCIINLLGDHHHSR